ncbi:MAG: hypothetical protein PVH84_14970 [Candidatus Aminicenantes bacterium]|jgi:hypothetical protein
MIKILYHLIVLFLTINLVWYLFREKQFWAQVSTALVLIMFLLRLFLIK